MPAMTSRKPTMEDVAARAGVSRALVSIVFRAAPGASTATRERVLAAARELDYHPDTRASRLGRTRTRTLGIVFGVGHTFHGDLIESLYAAADTAGYELVLSGVTARRREATAVQTLLAERCEALVLIGSTLPNAEMARLAGRLPLVSVLRAGRTPGVEVVRTDDADGLRQAVAHLAELGHAHIAHCDGGRAPGAAQRRQGYRSTMRRLGGAAEAVELPGGLTEEDGAACATAFLARKGPRPTAVTAFNDRCALGFIDTVRRSGLRVPEEVSVVGFDDIRQAGYPHISLTTVRQDADQLGVLALQRVCARLDDGETEARELVVAPTLVVRTSTAQRAAR
jgi:DNA-binding LacI/PurR family transcriptional regulator